MSNLTDINPEDQTEYDRRREAYEQAQRDFNFAAERMRATGDLFLDFRSAAVARNIEKMGIQKGYHVNINYAADVFSRYRNHEPHGFYLGATAKVVTFARAKQDGTRGKRRINIGTQYIKTLTKRETQET